MFVNFNDVFHPTEDRKRKNAMYMNDILNESLKNNGECCCNCKHMHLSHIGLDIMLPYCRKKKQFIDEGIKCRHYEFCGFIKID